MFTRDTGIEIHGYGSLSDYNTTPFAAEDIIVVTYGACSSTCSVFSELIRQRARVKFISLGGRPRKGITQAVGGTKGSNVYSWRVIQQFAYDVMYTSSSRKHSQQLNTTELNQYWSEIPFNRAARGTEQGINVRNAIRDGDETNTPLQFVYEPSDCRILYTKAMTVDMTAIWEAVAETAWGGKSHCVAGSLGGGKSSTTHGIKKRELTLEDRELSERMRRWRRDLKMSDYPLDV